jgi:hypothetical protein
MMEDRTDQTLDELLAKLPRDIVVPQDLWPGIERSIKRKPHRLGFLAFAASVAAVCMAGALTWAVLHERQAGRGISTAASPKTLGFSKTLGFDEPRDPAYRAARAELEKSFRERLAMLDPGTRAKVEASLALIRQAHEEIRKSLAAQPADPVLEHLLESTWHDEFDLYNDVVRGTQPTMLRS